MKRARHEVTVKGTLCGQNVLVSNKTDVNDI